MAAVRRWNFRHYAFKAGFCVLVICAFAFIIGFAAPAWRDSQTGLWMDCTHSCRSLVTPSYGNPAWFGAVRGLECFALIGFLACVALELYQDFYRTEPRPDNRYVECIAFGTGFLGVTGVIIFAVFSPGSHWGFIVTTFSSVVTIILACILAYFRTSHRRHHTSRPARPTPCPPYGQQPGHRAETNWTDMQAIVDAPPSYSEVVAEDYRQSGVCQVIPGQNLAYWSAPKPEDVAVEGGVNVQQQQQQGTHIQRNVPQNQAIPQEAPPSYEPRRNSSYPLPLRQTSSEAREQRSIGPASSPAGPVGQLDSTLNRRSGAQRDLEPSSQRGPQDSSQAQRRSEITDSRSPQVHLSGPNGLPVYESVQHLYPGQTGGQESLPSRLGHQTPSDAVHSSTPLSSSRQRYETEQSTGLGTHSHEYSSSHSSSSQEGTASQFPLLAHTASASRSEGDTDRSVPTTSSSLPTTSSIPVSYVTTQGRLVPVYDEEGAQTSDTSAQESVTSRVPSFYVMKFGRMIPVYSEEGVVSLDDTTITLAQI